MIAIAIFASGAGSNAGKIIEYFNQPAHRHIAKVELIVCNKKGAGVISIAEQHKIEVLMVSKHELYETNACLEIFRARHIGLIVLAGFLWKIPATLINEYRGRIINIHPALLPLYGGQGMYGQHVHEAVIRDKQERSGITIHYVDEHYDNGDIIHQESIDIDPTDTPQTLAARIHQLEHNSYPRVIAELASRL